jgi:hypothetical protein
VTLRTHSLPEFFGGVFATIRAASDDAYRRLIAKTVKFYAQALFNPHWGEEILIGRGYVKISMVFRGLDRQQAEVVRKPFFDWIAASPQDFAIVSTPKISEWDVDANPPRPPFENGASSGHDCRIWSAHGRRTTRWPVAADAWR